MKTLKTKSDKKISSVWIYVFSFLSFILLTSIIVSVCYDDFRKVWSMWVWYIFLVIIVSVLLFSLFKVIRRLQFNKYLKIKNKGFEQK